MVSKVLIGLLGWAVVVCPGCGAKKQSRPGKELQNKVLDQICICGLEYQIIFDNRFAHRKKCSFPGVLLAEKDIPVIIKDISEIGASFEGDVNGLEIGSFYKLKVKISQDWIEGLTRITRVNHKMVGVVFSGLGTDQKNIIESYVLPEELADTAGRQS